MSADDLLKDNRKWVLDKLGQPAAVVACGSCTACCKNTAVFLYPEKGDDPRLYDTVKAIDPYFGREGLMLAHHDNGDCVYLGERGCTIHANRPAICRAYDCGARYGMLSRVERRRLKRNGGWNDVWKAGERQWLSRNPKA